MRIEVKFHHSARQDLIQWRRTFGPRGKNRRDLFQIALDVMRERFIGFAGLPPDAVPGDTPGGRAYRWRYSDRVEVEFTVTERPRHPRGWWDVIGMIRRGVGPVVRTVVISRIVLRPRR